MLETWKDIAGFEGYYQISNFGNVRSVTRAVHHPKGGVRVCRSRPIKPALNGDGYYFVVLQKNHTAKPYRINRLVAEAFIGNPANLPCVNHIDKNRLNNHVDNLEWCTVEYNNRYSTNKAVSQYDDSGKHICDWEAVSDVTRQLRINASNIIQCCRGKRKTAGGYIWKYKEA